MSIKDVSLSESAKNGLILITFACMGDFFTAALKPAFSDILAALFRKNNLDTLAIALPDKQYQA